VGRDFVRRAFDAANQIGDLTCAAFSCEQMNTNMLAAGDPLLDVQREAEHGVAFAQKARFGLGVDDMTTQLGLVRTLRGLTPNFGCFDDEQFDESRIERRFASNPDLARAECEYWIRKLQARFIAGDYAAAIHAAALAQRLLWTAPARFATAEYHFYGALSRACLCDSALPGERQRHVEPLLFHHRQLEIWAENCPENFENRAALVGAEIARLDGRDNDAMRLYEKAIRSARDNGFVHHEAIAHERAASFYRERGFDQFADLYLRNARYGYLCWGANGKVRQLEDMHPSLRTDERPHDPTSTITAPVDLLDLSTVIRVSQAVSSEIVQDRLIDTLMRTAIEQAGAQRGLLILPNGDEQRIAAEATIIGETVVVRQRDEPVTAAALPETVLHYALRSGEIVLLDDAAAQPPHATDPYIRRHRAHSVLCLPLVNQAEVTGALYLENNLTPYAFASARVAVLKLLASQAAISLKNTLLYRDLEQREAKIRRLVDANIIGICISRPNGDIVEANDAFLKIVKYDRADLIEGRVQWLHLTAPESLERSKLALEEIGRTGAVQPFEKEYIAKDGARVPVLIGVAGFDDERDLMVAFVLDLSERKQAEAEARESERRYRETQGELAHANRVATMGQLTASVAHEVSQPVAASLANAQAAMRWLKASRPNLDEANQALARILDNGNRASQVIGRIRALIKKSPSLSDGLSLNDAILEVAGLVRYEAAKNGVSMRTQLAADLPTIRGDRVQLQQVILNLMVNAIEAMSESEGATRELTISTKRTTPDGVLVVVQDTGPGLPAENVERIFDAFYTTKAAGMGMGLSICRSIIEAHGGRLWATSNAPQGAIFHFTVAARSDSV
ncbi:MAG: GAF domain-containing protein, partial [Hyphomicrobiales bacterium]|nr:GAF domain-containing protein [Hyphomicrobiales bacterium]